MVPGSPVALFPVLGTWEAPKNIWGINEAGGPKFKTQFCYFWSWASYLPSLLLIFPIYDKRRKSCKGSYKNSQLISDLLWARHWTKYFQCAVSFDLHNSPFEVGVAIVVCMYVCMYVCIYIVWLMFRVVKNVLGWLRYWEMKMGFVLVRLTSGPLLFITVLHVS